MAFFNSAITILQTLVVALGAGLGAWGVINLLEGYGNDNPGAKSQGIKQLIPMKGTGGGRRRCPDRHSADPSAVRPVRISGTTTMGGTDPCLTLSLKR